MGAEQSVLNKTKNLKSKLSPSSNPTSKVQDYRTSVEELSPEFRQFLQNKQLEFEELVRERDQLRLDLAASELASQSIDDAYVRYIQKLRESRINAIAHAISWQAIVEAIESESNRPVKSSESKSVRKSGSTSLPGLSCANADAKSL